MVRVLTAFQSSAVATQQDSPLGCLQLECRSGDTGTVNHLNSRGLKRIQENSKSTPGNLFKAHFKTDTHRLDIRSTEIQILKQCNSFGN